MKHRPLRYVKAFIDRHGHARHYFRKPGAPRTPLPGLPYSSAFMTVYMACLNGQLKADPVSPTTKAGSLRALAVSYYESHAFTALAKSSKGTYRRTIDKLCEAFGELSATTMQRSHVVQLMNQSKDTPQAANQVRKVLRCLMTHAVDIGWRNDDPTMTTKRFKTNSDGHHSWDETEIARFEAVHPIGSRQRLALGLLLYLGQRRGDTVRMGRQHMTKDGGIRVKQEKTGAVLEIGLHSELAKLLPADNMTFLLTEYGKPFTPGGFSDWFRKACDAGLRHCCAHGLRKAAARRLAEAGCTEHEIAAITGHASLREVQRYTKAANQKKLAKSAMAKVSTLEPRVDAAAEIA
jgi:site-specific recombinase XerD